MGTWQLSKPEAYEATLSALKAGYRHIGKENYYYYYYYEKKNLTKRGLPFAFADTAAIYHNERSIGKAIKDSGIPREEIWLTSKLSPYDQGYTCRGILCVAIFSSDERFDAALSAFSKSIEKLNTTYLDLYLIHWPGKNGIFFIEVEQIYWD